MRVNSSMHKQMDNAPSPNLQVGVQQRELRSKIYDLSLSQYRLRCAVGVIRGRVIFQANLTKSIRASENQFAHLIPIVNCPKQKITDSPICKRMSKIKSRKHFCDGDYNFLPSVFLRISKSSGDRRPLIYLPARPTFWLCLKIPKHDIQTRSMDGFIKKCRL